MHLARILHRSSWILVALAGAAGACQPGRNPVLHVPAPPTYLTLKGRVVSDSGAPLWARVSLVRLARRGSADTLSDVAADAGQFRFDSLVPGAYALFSRSIGYHARKDTLALFSRPGPELILELRPDRMCLDMCALDSTVVAAARALRSKWQCDREKASIDLARNRWAEFLADSAMRTYFHHQLSPPAIARQLQRVRDDAVCRRLAIALFPDGISLAYTVFRWPPYWLVSDPDFGDAIVADDGLRPLAASYGGGFAVWMADRRIP